MLEKNVFFSQIKKIFFPSPKGDFIDFFAPLELVKVLSIVVEKNFGFSARLDFSLKKSLLFQHFEIFPEFVFLKLFSGISAL